MNVKTLLRSSLIRTAGAVRADELALALRTWLARRRHSPYMLAIEMHETPEEHKALFRQQLEWASQHFIFVDLPAFIRLWQEYRQNPKSWTTPPLLFTFDDGRENNYTVAAPVLESFGARGVFFVVPQFVQCGPAEARKFYYSRIDTREHAPVLPEKQTRSMSPEQIADLASRGHSIGNHTYSHVNLAELTDAQMHHEIVHSAEQIAAWTGRPVDAFAWTFSWDSITPQAWRLIQQHHRYCFAPCPGSVDCRSDSPELIWRTEIEATYPQSDFRFMYSGLADWLWRGKRKRLRVEMKNTSASH